LLQGKMQLRNHFNDACLEASWFVFHAFTIAFIKLRVYQLLSERLAGQYLHNHIVIFHRRRRQSYYYLGI
jgi:hypothetical protein